MLKQQCYSWLQLRSESAALLIILSVSLTAAIKRESLSAGWAAVTILLSFILTDKIPQFLMNIANIREHAKTISSIKEIIKHDEKEDDWFSVCPPPENWPAQGSVHINKVAMGQITEPSTPDESEDRVNDRIIDIAPGECVQIVDPHDLLFPAFCQIGNVQNKCTFEGSIIIDGIDITKLGLFELRAALNIIPKESCLFSGSVVDNIDPNRELTNEEYKHILSTSGLIVTIQK